MRAITHSLPARVALATSALLALILLAVAVSAYAVTAVLLRLGVDRALLTAVPASSATLDEMRDEVERYDDDDDDHRRLQVLDPSGVVRFGEANLPVDERAVRTALKSQPVYVSQVQRDGLWRTRVGPAWWLAMTPAKGEVRVLYAPANTSDGPVVLQMAAPVGPASEVLPALLRGLLILGAVATLFAGLVVWRMADRTYQPLRAIIATTDDISTRTPALRIPQRWPDGTLRQLVQVLNAMIGRLQSAYEAQGRFVAAAAHELRSPLGAMRAELEVALRRERTPEEYRQALGGALEETARLTALAEHLLVLARYERGAALVMERDVPLRSLLERAAGEVRKAAGGEVWVEAPEGLRLDGDSIALERMVINLARNGIQAGGSPVRITAGVTGDSEVCIRVADQGRGIPREALPHIFEPFYRADPARGREGGTGLGLAIVKTVVAAHGGRIEVESRPGLGTIFSVWLPISQKQ